MSLHLVPRCENGAYFSCSELVNVWVNDLAPCSTSQHVQYLLISPSMAMFFFPREAVAIHVPERPF